MKAEGSDSYICLVNGYDVKGRLTQAVQGNLLGGHDVTTTVYTFTGKPAVVSHTHTASGKPEVTEVTTYTYDHAERLTKVEHTLGGVTVTLVSNTYDELGRLQSNTPHGNTALAQSYTYNIRDWLTGIGGKFTQSLQYNDGATPCYNGNISGMTWKAGNETTTRGYKFTYDGLNRLSDAVYGEGTSLSSNVGRFTEKVTGYDRNGNILALQRYGQTGASSYGLIDNLTFTLNGNQLNRVDDAAGTAAYNNGFEFKDAVKQENEYAYDANGNLTKDLNRNISNIQYNFLNLPSKVVFADGSTIEYVYAADGTKLRTKHVINGTTTTTDYCGNVVYENGVQKLLLTEEGYVTLADKQYHYFLKDHQGNNRMVVNASGTVEETNHYYPFGGLFASSGNAQPYKYNGKELDTENGLNWYDYGARHYDPALGRFTTMDRFADKYSSMSPYQYGANNPVNIVDINGDSLSISDPSLIKAIENGFEKGSNVQMVWNNGVLDPNSIKEQALNGNDFFLKDLYEIASSDKMVELSLSDVNTYKLNGEIVREPFETPEDVNTHIYGKEYNEMLRMQNGMTGKVIEGDLGQTLVPGKAALSGKSSLNNRVQVTINGKGTLNQRTVGLAHEFGHVILYLRNLPFGHTQKGVDSFVFKRNDNMMRRLGYGE